MCLAEKRAQEKKVGLFAKLDSVQIRRITDMTLDASHANSVAMLPHLKNRITGVVDYVFSATRIKVFIPSQNSMMAFVCAGVQAPHNTDKDPKMAAIAEEGIRAMRKLVHMRDITIINVEAADQRGNFIATMECNGENLSCFLVERGLAWVNEGRRTIISSRLHDLENKAKEEKRGFWEFYVPPAEEEEVASEKKVKEFFEATVSDLGENGSFYLQKKEDAEALEELTQELEEAAETSAQRDLYVHTAPKNKQMILAQFSDGTWCRASYLGGVSGDASMFNVLYIDFGTTEACPRSKTMPLPAEFTTRPPLARHARLAFIEPPSASSPYADDYLQYLEQLTADKTLTVTVEYMEDGVLCVSLADNATHINAAMVREGLATLNKKRVGAAPADGKDQFAPLREAQEKARAERLNMWKYGDIGDDDDDDDTRRRPRRR